MKKDYERHKAMTFDIAGEEKTLKNNLNDYWRRQSKTKGSKLCEPFSVREARYLTGIFSYFFDLFIFL